MRWTPSNVLNTLAFIVIALLLLALFWPNGGGNFKDYSCDLSKSYQINLHKLVYVVHDALEELRLTHFLCYKSLLGQIKKRASLPWERNANFCILNEDRIKLDILQIQKVFKEKGLILKYDDIEGKYIANQEKKSQDTFDGFVEIIVVSKEIPIFINENNFNGYPAYYRIGKKRENIQMNCEQSPELHCFPTQLVKIPLPLKYFGSKILPVPREDIELLKYQFPNSWWRDDRPVDC